jgi:hypothetical protein
MAAMKRILCAGHEKWYHKSGKKAKARSKVMQDADVLKGWGEIAQYVGMDVSDTLRLAKLDGLPYFKLGYTVYCRKSRLDHWAKTVSHGRGIFLVPLKALGD